MSTGRRCSAQAGRKALRSPGRPPVARREDRRLFWSAIAAGRSSEDAAVDAGVSPPVGARWFREAGGMPPSHLAPKNKLANRLYEDCRAIVDACCQAWNDFVENPAVVTSVTKRAWAHVS